ncbi:MAG: hypothetical protein M3171_06295 [Actinomycetota bacterium]|nr:hypothetical protein [Actinomycetota bacterium]
MDTDAPDEHPNASNADSAGDFEASLIPQEKNQTTKSMAENRATADSDPDTEPAETGEGDKNTDPNAQPPL